MRWANLLGVTSPRLKSARDCVSSSSMPFCPAPETDWYVETMTRCRPAASCSGFITTTSWMVLQFGLAMMRRPGSACFTVWGFTSGTTSGTSASMRKALELSITTAPARAACGANSRDTEAPGAKSAISTPANESRLSRRTGTSSPRNSSVWPPHRSGARGSDRAGRAEGERLQAGGARDGQPARVGKRLGAGEPDAQTGERAGPESHRDGLGRRDVAQRAGQDVAGFSLVL